MENIDQAPAERENTAGWLQKLPEVFRDVNEGVMNDMMRLTLRYFEQVRIAAARCEDAPSVHKLFELHQKFSLWTDGDSDLDRRLIHDPAVRKLIVSNLANLVINLSTGSSQCSMLIFVLPLTLAIGVNLFTPENQQNLVEETNRVLEQASKLAHSHLKQSTSCPSRDILAFCDSVKHIESRIDNLYILLPTTRHLVENLDEREPRQAEESRLGEGEPLSDSHIKQVHQRLRQSVRQMRSRVTSVSQSSSTSHSGKNSRRLRLKSSNLNTKQSSVSKDSPSTFSLLSQDDTRGSARPLTDTNTSNTPPEVTESSSEATNSDLIGVSSSCKKCRTIFSDPAGLE